MVRRSTSAPVQPRWLGLLLGVATSGLAGCPAFVSDDYVFGPTGSGGAATGGSAGATGIPTGGVQGTGAAAGGGAELPATCTNDDIDGDETGTDCGGTLCPACPEGEPCTSFRDCLSRYCLADGTCSEP